MFGDLLGKMAEAQKGMEESKKRLNGIYVDAEAENGLVKVTMNGNKKITNLSISETLIDGKDKDAIEDLVIMAINKAIEKAEKVYESEMQNVAKGMLPGMF